MPYEPTTNFRDSNNVDLGRKLVTKDYLLEVYGTILESSGATGLVVTPELWVWGRGDNGRLGTNNTDTKNTPVTTLSGGTNWKQVSGGYNHTAAIKTDGSLWIWGGNVEVQLGTNDTTQRNTPVTTFAGENNWKQVNASLQYTTAIKTDGTLWVWGRGDNVRLGTNDTTYRSTPVTTFAGGTTWKSVGGGGYHTVAIKTDGSLWTWGAGGNGRLGTNDTTNRSTPVTTFAGGTTWKSVSSGIFAAHTAAIKTDGSLWTWGANGSGQLGDFSTTQRNVPVTTFAGGTTWKQVSTGENHTAAIKTDGSLWTWGAGGNGQLGNFSATDRSTPVTTFAGGNNWKSVDCGGSHTAAIKTDGSLWTWGRNEEGQLGTNDITNRSTPVTTFIGGNDWKSVACGSRHTIAIKSIDYI
jgi:alpha-tubulin suppressor-like RCC1 family protein